SRCASSTSCCAPRNPGRRASAEPPPLPDEQEAHTMAAAGSSTRERFSHTSQRLCNKEGVAATSTHRIAAELGISPGNLHYHFKTKQAIVTWLFRRFQERFEACLDAAAAVTAPDDLWLSLHLTFETINEYRFVYRDIDSLLNGFPELEARAPQLTARHLISAEGLSPGVLQRRQ